MPKSKARKSSSSDSDSGPDDKLPVKKSKPAPAKSSGGGGGGGGGGTGGDSNELCWDIGKNRSVKLSEFKGKWYVNIREYYLADGELRPGKKGIMLTMEQWQKFKSCLPDVEEAIKKHV